MVSTGPCRLSCPTFVGTFTNPTCADMSPDEFLDRQPDAKPLFAAIQMAVNEAGQASIRVTKSQIAFCRHRNFAFVWLPHQYLRGKVAPLVLTLSLPTRMPSPRWKQVVEPAPGHFTHHLEVHRVEDVDEEVVEWLRLAWEAA